MLAQGRPGCCRSAPYDAGAGFAWLSLGCLCQHLPEKRITQPSLPNHRLRSPKSTKQWCRWLQRWWRPTARAHTEAWLLECTKTKAARASQANRGLFQHGVTQGLASDRDRRSSSAADDVSAEPEAGFANMKWQRRELQLLAPIVGREEYHLPPCPPRHAARLVPRFVWCSGRREGRRGGSSPCAVSRVDEMVWDVDD